MNSINFVPGGVVKKVWFLPVLVVVVIYGTGLVRLSESGAERFLKRLEALSSQGKAERYCALLHADLAVSVRDNTAPGQPREITGGKTQLCEYVGEATKGMELIDPQTSFTRENFRVTRNWLHPWTAHVSYHEKRTTRMSPGNVTLHTTSDDRWTLVNTFEGVRVLRLEADSKLAD